jgi:hypothetical protein
MLWKKLPSLIVLFGPKKYLEHRSLILYSLRADKAAVIFHDTTTDREPDSGTGELIPAVQALEHFKDLLRLFGVEADPIIPDLDPIEAYGTPYVSHLRNADR